MNYYQQKDWWDEGSFVPGLNRNELLLIVIGVGLVALEIFATSWDWVFGLR